MERKNKLVLFLLIVLVMTVALISSFGLNIFAGKGAEIVLPTPAATSSGEDEGLEGGGQGGQIGHGAAGDKDSPWIYPFGISGKSRLPAEPGKESLLNAGGGGTAHPASCMKIIGGGHHISQP